MIPSFSFDPSILQLSETSLPTCADASLPTCADAMPIATQAPQRTRVEVFNDLQVQYDGQKNVLGTSLKQCTDHDHPKVTGWRRDGFCGLHGNDRGMHIVCCQVTTAFLQWSKSIGNDMITPRPPIFWGLADGDHWCICAERWLHAHQVGKAPLVYLEATHEKTLDAIPLKYLLEYAADKEAALQVQMTSLDVNAQGEDNNELAAAEKSDAAALAERSDATAPATDPLVAPDASQS